jgi:hypothetical protein
MKKLGLPLIIVMVLVALIGLFMLGNKPEPAKKSNEPLLGTKHDNQGQDHINEGASHAAYNSTPPSSGPHYATPASWGMKEAEIKDETMVHNLEHGGIAILYRPDLPKDQIDKLKQIFDGLPVSEQFNEVKAILAPRSSNSAPIQLAAWTYTLDLQTADKAKITEFYKDHIDKGPELVP